MVATSARAKLALPEMVLIAKMSTNACLQIDVIQMRHVTTPMVATAAHVPAALLATAPFARMLTSASRQVLAMRTLCAMTPMVVFSASAVVVTQVLTTAVTLTNVSSLIVRVTVRQLVLTPQVAIPARATQDSPETGRCAGI